jgi:hypothetical protein
MASKRPMLKRLFAVLQGARLCHTCHTRYVYSHERLAITCGICEHGIKRGHAKRGT